jgi:hypothetical protein
VQASLFANLSSLTLSPSLTGGSFSWPKIPAGADLTVGLRFAENLAGTVTEIPRELESIKVSLGRADARPTSGSYKLHLGDEAAVAGVNLTAAIAHNATAAEIQAALDALTGFGAVTVTQEAGTYRILVGDGSTEISAEAVENTLRPVAFVEWQAVVQNGEYVHELRLTQTPVAQTVDFALVAPEGPSIAQVQAGGTNSDIAWNEIQRLYVPPNFRGTFVLQRGYRKTAPLATPLDLAAVEDAIQALADDGGEFILTEEQDALLIEFGGELGGIDQALLEVAIISQPEGDPTFTLRTATAELWSALSGANASTGELPLQLEIKIVLADEEGDEDDKTYIFKQPLTVVTPVDAEERNAASEIDWNQPRGRRAVLPFTPGQVLIGNRSYAVNIGNGSATSFTINHNLGEPTVQVAIRENASGGRIVIHGLEYETAITNNNSLTITPQAATLTGGVLATGAWTVLVVSAGQAVYQAHEHAIGEVIGLRAELDALGAAVNALEDLAPTGALTSRDAAPGTPVAQWILPSVLEAYPGRAQLALGAEESLMDLPAVLLPRDGGLVGAVHSATATDTTTLPSDPTAGTLYRYTGTADLLLPGGLGRRSVMLKTNEHLTWDGRVWYKLVQIDDTKPSWYPEDFDRELFVLAVSSKQLIAKRVAELQIGFEVALRSTRERDAARYTGDLRNTQAQWVLVIEHGAFTAETSPSTPDLNLKAINWNPTPILRHRLIVTRNAGTHSFGVRINRSSAGVLSTDAIFYGAAEAGGSIPATADFALRARLIQFDILDGLADPRGLLLLRGLDVSLTDGESSTGKMIIR